MVKELDYNLYVSVDVGFSGSKVTINGITFTIPNAIVDITNRDKFIAGIHKKDFICTTYVENKKNLVGAQARMLQMEPEYKKQMETKQQIMDSYDKFTTVDSEVHLMTCIGMALIKYSEYTKENKIKPEFDYAQHINDKESMFKIYIILGYPNDIYSEVYAYVKPTIAKRHQFNIETENGDYNLDFTINPNRTMTYSQALALFMGLILDDNGNMRKDRHYLEMTPAIIVDGGQKTVGIYKITSNMQISMDESNTDFAMNNVYEEVVENIRNLYHRKDIELYNIEEIIKNKDGVLVYHDADTDTTKMVDLKPMFEECRKKICQEFIAYLNQKFNNLMDVKQIVIGGGTGAAYYDEISDYVDNHRQHISDHVSLTSYEFNGKDIDPSYAVSVGLYKILRREIMSQKAEDTTQGK